MALFLLPVLFFAGRGTAFSEKIYLKDGRMISGKIAGRYKGTVWVLKPEGSVGIQAYSIFRIENEDGSISKYDYFSVIDLISRQIQSGQEIRAIESCGFFIEAFPDYAPMRLLRAGLNQKNGYKRAAAQDYDYLISRGVVSAMIYNNRGVIYAQDKDLARAGLFFLDALKIQPDMAEASRNRELLKLPSAFQDQDPDKVQADAPVYLAAGIAKEDILEKVRGIYSDVNEMRVPERPIPPYGKK